MAVSKINVKKHTKRGTETRADILDTIGGSGGTAYRSGKKPDIFKLKDKPRQLKKTKNILADQKKKAVKKKKVIKRTSAGVAGAVAAGVASQWINYKD